MKVTCLPKIVIQDYLNMGKNCGGVIPTKPSWALISICEEVEDRLFQNETSLSKMENLGCVYILPLEFWDIGDELEGYDDKKFSIEQAKQIVTMVDNCKDDVNEFVIHCHAGISRSGAIGSFIVEYLKLDYQEFKKRNPTILPNPMVLRKLFEVSGIQAERVQFYNTMFKDPIDKKFIPWETN